MFVFNQNSRIKFESKFSFYVLFQGNYFLLEFVFVVIRPIRDNLKHISKHSGDKETEFLVAFCLDSDGAALMHLGNMSTVVSFYDSF